MRRRSKARSKRGVQIPGKRLVQDILIHDARPLNVCPDDRLGSGLVLLGFKLSQLRWFIGVKPEG